MYSQPNTVLQPDVISSKTLEQKLTYCSPQGRFRITPDGAPKANHASISLSDGSEYEDHGMYAKVLPVVGSTK